MPSPSSELWECDEGYKPAAIFRNLSFHTREHIVVPGTNGKSDKVFRVCEQEIPKDLMDALLLPFSPSEREEIFHHVDMVVAEANHEKPKALWIFGPPAVGKTTLANEKGSELFGRADNAVTVDGDIFRMVHKGFQMVAHHGLRNNLVHAEAWPRFKKTGYMDKLKVEVVEKATSMRQHLLIPETAVNVDRVNKMLDQLADAGYEMHAVCLWAPKSMTIARGRIRSVKNGKVFSTEAYASSNRGALAFGELWEGKLAQGDCRYRSVQYFDNTVFPCRRVHLSEYKTLVNMSDEDGDKHAAMCMAAKHAAETAEIAASEALANGAEMRRVVSVALAAWRKAQKRKGGSASVTPILSSVNWSDPMILIAERERGRIEGLLIGAAMTAGAMAVLFHVLRLKLVSR